ncbi:MAG TPA: UDP-N-acetylmuramoyl-tripeptide--D-alanyl-D-alanine ligase, partial [Halieaceae bacterium]|nr:UDP-N-acetylmuramoyl-tripeptide--D-alanyl-D-alanine ligase [Halieaceae bacterium]
MMRDFHLGELCEPLQARLRGGDLTVSGVTTDSRKVAAGDLFVALQGEHFDGHDFLANVASAGAVAAVVGRDLDTPLALLQVT